MWNNNSRKNVPNWHGRGDKFGNNRRSGARTFQRRKTPERLRPMSKRERVGGQFNEDKNFRYLDDDQVERRAIYNDERLAVERESRLPCDNRIDGLNSDRDVNESSRGDGYRIDIERYNSDDIYSRDIGNQNQDQFIDRNDEFVGHDQDMAFGSDRGLDNRRYKSDDYNRDVDLKYDSYNRDIDVKFEEKFTGNIQDTRTGSALDWQFGDEMPIGESDRWKSGNSSQFQDRFSGNDDQSFDRNVFGNVGEDKYSYEINDYAKTELHMDQLQLSTGINPALHKLSEGHYKTSINISRENRERNNSRTHNRKHVGNSSKYLSRRNDSLPYKLEKSRHIHGPKVGTSSVKQHDVNFQPHEAGVKRHELGRPLKNETKRRSDHLSRSCTSSTSKDSRSDSRSSAKNSKDVKHSKDEARDKAASQRNSSSKSNSHKEHEKASSRDNQNKTNSHSRTGLNSNRPRSGSREDNKRHPSSRSTPDSKRSSRIDGFKKPTVTDRQQSNTTNRSNSSRRMESESGHYEDDILSIMADDDAFDNEHKSGNASSNSMVSRKHSRDSNSRENRSSSLRDKRNQEGFHRQNSKDEADRNKEPVFEIHAESSASIFGDSVDRPGKYRGVEKSGGSRSSFSSDHSRVKKTGNLSMKRSEVSKKGDRRRNRSNRYTDKGLGRSLKDSRELTTQRKFGHVKDIYGKSGALLREDRQDSAWVRNYNSKGKVQNFRAGARIGNRFVDSKFKNKNSFYTDRVKRKYFRGGFKGFSNDWDFSVSKGNHTHSRVGMDRRKRVDDRNERPKKKNDRSDNRNDGFDSVNVDDTIKDDKGFNDFPLNVDQQVNSKQQIVFIPNQDISGGVPPVVDQFGRIMYNDLSEQAIEGQIPVQYVPEQYPADGTAVGEQLVFIPFVNQMTSYPENMPNPLDNSSGEKVKDDHNISLKNPQHPKKKPLSKDARAVLRKKLEAKRKKRMEEEIERRLLKKLFGTSGAMQVVKGEESSQVKKKPVIKRISPPLGNEPSHLHKTVKLVKKTDDVIDISDEERSNQYDSVSDLEDVSDDEEYDNRKDKRPVFRKPGEPRKGNRRQIGNRSGISYEDDHKLQDIRRVVQSSINQNNGRIENAHGQKRQRSLYAEEPDTSDISSSSLTQTAGVGNKKNRRSISPIEITVSNERYSKVPSSRRRGTGDCKDEHKNRDGNFVKREKSLEKFSHSFGDQKYSRENPTRGRDEKGGHRHQERSDVKRLDGSRSREEDSAHKFDTRGSTHNSRRNFEASQMSDDRKFFGYGKYKDRSAEDSKSDQGRSTVSKYRNDRGNNSRSDKQSEWENCNSDRSIGNLKNDVDSHQFDRISGVERDRSPTLGSPSHFHKKALPSTYKASPPFTQLPVEGHSFNQSISIPPQFSKQGPGVDHSLPPVQNAPITMPPFPPTSLVRPDMSLPPPVGSVGNNSHLIQASNSGNFQQNFGIQSQHFQPLHQQYPQQQQQQPVQVLQQDQSQFQMQQPMYSSSLGQNQMGLQHIQPNQFQQTQSNVGIVPVNQNLMSDHMTQQITTRVPQLNQGNFKQVFKTSHNQQALVKTNSQGVRGVIGTIKTSGSNSAPGLRVAQVDTGFAGRNLIQSPTSNTGRLPLDEDAYFEDLVQMVCSKCNCMLLDHGLMKAHGRWHDMIESNDKNWRCDQCEQGYLSSSAYSEHMDSKHTYNSWNCSLCILSFSYSSGLNKHIRHSTHKNLKVKFVCSLCPASFMVLTHLIQHKKESHQSNSGYSGFKKF